MEIKLKTLLPEEQLENKIVHGFHQALNKNKGEYRQDFTNALIQAKNLQEIMSNREKGFISIIEPRIPFRELVSLQELDIDPAVFYIPRYYPEAQPYAVWAEIFSNKCSMPESFRQASPLEGIQMNQEFALNTFPVLVLPGGEYENFLYAPNRNRIMILVLEHYLGKCRLSQICRHELDGLVGILCCWEGSKND